MMLHTWRVGRFAFYALGGLAATGALATGVACGPSATVNGQPLVDAPRGGGDIDAPPGTVVADARMLIFPDVNPALMVDAEVCNQTTPIMATMTVSTPDMLIVLDKSGSMNESITSQMNGASRISTVKSALDTILPATNTTIHWGLMTFPSDNSCGAGKIIVGITPSDASAVETAVNAVTPGGSTPTPDSLTAALTYFNSIPVNPDGRFVLLATDGEPNCAPGDQMGSTATQSVTAVATLKTAGIKTFVIGVGTDVSDSTTLTNMAVAGGTTMFYPATSPAELQSALAAITGSVQTVSCTYTLEATPPDPTKLAVTLDGTAVPQDSSHMTGWDYSAGPPPAIIFYGPTCAMIQSGSAHTIAVDYGCGGPIISRQHE